MENNCKHKQHHRSSGLFFGLVLVILGFIFLGSNLGVISENLRHVLISWQMLLIVIGIGDYVKRKLITGTILLLIGGFFFIPHIVHYYPAIFPGIQGNFVDLYWPFLLILAGVLLILHKIFGPKSHEFFMHKHTNKAFKNKFTYSNEALRGGFSKNSIFGGGDHIVLDPQFKGGDMNAIFGGLTLDLRRTNLTEGETRLEINAIFGGITIYVPQDWFVETQIDTVFGGFQDNRQIRDDVDKSKKLLIVGACVFGGGELRN